MIHKTITKKEQEAKSLIQQLEENKYIILIKYSISYTLVTETINLIENWGGEPHRALINTFEFDKDELSKLDEITEEDEKVYVLYKYDTHKELIESKWDFDNYYDLEHKSMLFYGNLII